MLTFSLVPLVILLKLLFFSQRFPVFSFLYWLVDENFYMIEIWKFRTMCTMVAQSYTRIRQLINFLFPFVSTKRFHSPEYKVGIASYPCLSSCSTGILGLLVASFWGDFQNFYTRNYIMPPIAVDNTYIQISWDTHFFTFEYWSLFLAIAILHLSISW